MNRKFEDFIHWVAIGFVVGTIILTIIELLPGRAS